MTRIALATLLVALASPAYAQSVDCKPTETQAECHARLKCKADEELDACQQRLRSSGATTNGSNDNRDNRDSGGRETDRRDNDRRDNRRRDGGDDRYSDNSGRRQRGRDGGRRRRNNGGGRNSSFQANKTFGLGLELGEPTGLTGKYFLTDSRALDFGVGVAYEHYYYDDGIHLYLDHLWHPTSLASNPTFELPFYVGVGARFWDFSYCERVGNNDVCFDGSAFGVRVPIGIAFDFNNAPIDIFLQIVPTIDLIVGDYYDRFDDRNHFGIDGSVGFRFWFK